jgi:hypothetical protein
LDKPTKVDNFLTKVFQPNQSAKLLKFTELKRICIQEYTLEKIELNPEQILTTIRIWDPATWTLSPSREIMIPKKISCHELNSLLLKYFPDIKVDIKIK